MRMAPPRASKAIKFGKFRRLSRQQILRELRLDFSDKIKIMKYTQAKGVHDKDVRKKLEEHIHTLINITDAHNFSYKAFLVST